MARFVVVRRAFVSLRGSVFCGCGKSDVADAAMRGDAAAVQALIAKKVDVNAPQADGATALHWAVYRGDRDLAAILLRAGANPKAANREGVTPLWLASVNGDARMVAALIEAGADPNETLPLGRTPLMLASRTGNVETMKALLDNGANPNVKETLRGTTPMMWAADEGHEAAIKLLIERGADVNAKSNPAPRGGGPALGKANDPRKAVAAQAAAVAARQAAPSLGDLRALESTGAGGRSDWRSGRRAAGAAGGRGGGRAGGAGRGNADGDDAGVDLNDDAAVAAGFGRRAGPADGGGLTPLIFAARSNDLESVKTLLDAGVNVNQQTGYGWSALLVAAQNRYYKLGAYLIERGADVNLAHNGGWTPLYLATDNRNIENGDYPVRKPDMDHLDFIKLLLDKGANVNHRVKDSSETRTVFTNQWLDENGATAFLRASQSGDLELMKLLLSRGADPKINTASTCRRFTSRQGSAGSKGSRSSGRRKRRSTRSRCSSSWGSIRTSRPIPGRVALHGAAHKGRADVIQALADAGAKIDVRDYGNTDNRGGALAAHTWLPVDYADGLVRVGVQSAIAHPEAGLLLRKLMTARRPRGAADGPHARVHLHHRRLRGGAVKHTSVDLRILRVEDPPLPATSRRVFRPADCMPADPDCIVSAPDPPAASSSIVCCGSVGPVLVIEAGCSGEEDAAVLTPGGGRRSGLADDWNYATSRSPSSTIGESRFREARLRRVPAADSRAAVGRVEYCSTEKSGAVRAAREVVLCAGAVDSPRLLMLSGIGPAQHLRACMPPARSCSWSADPGGAVRVGDAGLQDPLDVSALQSVRLTAEDFTILPVTRRVEIGIAAFGDLASYGGSFAALV